MFKSTIKKVIRVLSPISAYKWKNRPNGIYCFNYHRVGEMEKDQFDPNVFSCTEKKFEQHLTFFKREFKVISMKELVQLVESKQPITERYAIITFDDGYIDNYQIAFPALKKHGLSATFYVVSDYVENSPIPWWDEIAYLIRKTKKTEVQLSNWKRSIDIKSGSTIEIVRRTLKAIKQDNSRTLESKLVEIRDKLEVTLPEDLSKERLFMNWEELKTMIGNGMSIGSHTVSHNILSHLSEKEQLSEICQSKETLEKNLNCQIDTIAYPVGGQSAFNNTTIEHTKAAGFKLGFSFINGINTYINEENKFSLLRIPVDEEPSISELKNLIATKSLNRNIV